jgi:RNA polymerase sigma-70 factor (ECF subfamily)
VATGTDPTQSIRGGWFEDEFPKHYRMLRAFAAAAGDSDMDPDDILQDAIVSSLAAQSRGTVVRDDLAYLRRCIVSNVSDRRLRLSQDRQFRSMKTDPVVEPEYPSSIASVLNFVDPADRALLYLVHVDGMTASEAATSVGVSHVAARARLSRARRRLRRLLREEES